MKYKVAELEGTLLDLAVDRARSVGPTGERDWMHYTTLEWSPALRAAIAACECGDRIGHVLQKEAGGPYTYEGIRSAWGRACAKAGVKDLHIHDLRGRAGVDAMGDNEDVRAAQRLLGHAGEAMTRHYVEGKYAKRVRPAK